MGLFDRLMQPQAPRRNLMDTQMVRRPSESYLRQDYPTVYGALGGLFGTAPDEMAGSVLDPNTAAVRRGAEYGFPVGTALGVSPLGPAALRGAAATGRFVAPKAGQLVEGYMQRMGMMPGILPTGSKATSKIDEITGLPLNSDGTVTLFHHTNKSAAEQIAKSGRLKSAGEPSVYLTTQKATDTGYGDVAVPVRVKPSLLNLDDEFPGGRMDFSIDTGKPKGSISVIVEKQLPQAPQQAALDLAQQRAALPVSEGGLGLPAGNTAEQRAAAMGFDTDAYHATDADIMAFDNSKLGLNTSYLTGGDADAVKSAMRGHWFSDRDLTNKDPRGYVFGDVSYPVKLSSPKKINDKEFGSISYIVKNPANIRSRFAAFDPFRRSAAIAATMGVAAPDLLANELDYPSNPMYTDPLGYSIR